MKNSDKFSQFIHLFQERLEKFPYKRKGKNKQYETRDAGLSAFGVFFTQSSSFLAYQRWNKKKVEVTFRPYLEGIKYRVITR